MNRANGAKNGRKYGAVFTCFRLILVVGAGHVLAVVPGFAQEEVEEPGFMELPPLVVTAGRIPQTAQEVPMNLTLLEREAVDASPGLAMDDVLRQVPGFSLFRRTSSLVAHPTTQGVSLRGVGPTGASRSLVLLDGIPLNDPFGGWVYWSRVPMLAVDRVEIVRGGGSTVWGNSAMGGVIQIFTRPPLESFYAVEALAGTRGTERFSLVAHEPIGPAGFLVEAEHFSTDGYRTVHPAQRGPIDIPAFSRHQILNGGVRAPVGEEANLFVKVSSFSESRGNGTPYTGNETEALRLSAVLDWRTGEGKWEWLSFAEQGDFASRFSAVNADRTAETPALDQFDVPFEAAGTGLVWSRDWDLHTLTAGVDGRWVSGETNEDFFFQNGAFVNRRRAGGEQILAGIFLEDVFQPNEDWQFSAGARLDYWRSYAGELRQWNIATGEEGERETFADREVFAFNPRAGAIRHLNEFISLRGGVYRGFRVPTINELYRPFRVGQDVTQANAGLDPEILSGAELGADVALGARWRGKVTGFYNSLQNPIANVTVGEGAGGGALRQRQNLGRAAIQGVELEIAFTPVREWELTGSYLYSEATVRRAAQQPDLVGNRLAQTPEHQFVLGSAWHWAERYRLNLFGRFVGAQFEDDLNTRELSSFWVFDARVAREFGPGSAIFAGVENLFDRTIETGVTGGGLVSVGAPRLVHGGIRWRF